VFCEDSAAAKSNSALYQAKDRFLADRGFKFAFPTCKQRSFHNRPTAPAVINERDLQHCFFPVANKAMQSPNSAKRYVVELSGDEREDSEHRASKKLKQSKLSKQ
jgi:hypothetical protein